MALATGVAAALAAAALSGAAGAGVSAITKSKDRKADEKLATINRTASGFQPIDKMGNSDLVDDQLIDENIDDFGLNFAKKKFIFPNNNKRKF